MGLVMGVREIDRSLEQWQMGVEGFASADDSGAHTQGAGAVVRHLALGAGLDSNGHGGGAGAGPTHHRTVGFGFRRGRAGGLDI